MNIFNKYCIALFGLIACLLPFTSSAQSGKGNIDSIKSFVQKLSTDSDKVNTLFDLAKGVVCEDSVKKLAIVMEAKHIATKIGWIKGIRKANETVGLIYFQCEKNYTKAFEYFNANLELARKNNDLQNEALALDVIAREYREINQHQKAIEYYYEELNLKPGITREASVYGNIGITYKMVGEYRGALGYYDSSLNLLKSKKTKDLQDTFEVAGVYLNMGEIYLSINDPGKALQQYIYALESGAPSKDKQFYIWSWTGMGKTYRIKKNYKEAVESYQKALQICREINGFEDEVKINGELANTYIETGELVKAHDYADSSLSLAETQHYIYLLSKCNTTLGNIYIKQDKYELAIDYLKKSLGIAKQTLNLEDQKDALEGLSIAYKKSGQWQDAYNAYIMFKELSDRLYSINTLNAITRSQITRDFTEKVRSDSLKSKMVFDKKIEKQRVLTYSGFIGFVLVIALAFFIFSNYKTQKKYNELLNREKERHLAHIEAQSNVLSEISHIQAHQIRGPVSTILGLVHIYNYDDAADPMNKQVMEWVASTTEKLDVVIKDIIMKENNLRTEHEEDEARHSNDSEI